MQNRTATQPEVTADKINYTERGKVVRRLSFTISKLSEKDLDSLIKTADHNNATFSTLMRRAIKRYVSDLSLMDDIELAREMREATAETYLRKNQ